MLWDYDPLPVLLFWVDVEQNLVFNGEERRFKSKSSGLFSPQGEALLSLEKSQSLSGSGPSVAHLQNCVT